MNRYPGIRPFRRNEQHLFFGRSDDVEQVYRLLRLEQCVILYGKSGYGKSSLLSAGIYPKMDEEARYEYWEVRFGPYRSAISTTPVDTVCATVSPQKEGAKQGQVSIWQALKNRQTSEQKRFILFFDQFEELFTYPPEQVAEFKQQLAEALYASLPKYAVTHPLNAEEEALLYEPFELKILCSIRSDRMALLKQLEDYLPNLLRYAFQLEALDKKQAIDVVTQPAALSQVADTGESFDTPPFIYTPETLAAIFRELSDETGRIETSALQIVCKHVEHNIVSFRTPPSDGTLLTVTAPDLGDLKTVFRTFYDQTIASLDEEIQPAARRLTEDVLIKDNIRLPFAEQALLTQPGITLALLEKLEKSSLLRVELDGQRRKIYEVGHDTLVVPIVEAAQTRRTEEERLRLLGEQQKQRREIEEALNARRRAWLITSGAILLTLIAVAAMAWALWQRAILQRKNIEVVESIIYDATDLIKHLQYNEAWLTMDKACQLGQEKVKSARVLMEIAYFHNETGNTKDAVTVARKASEMFEKNIPEGDFNSPPNAEAARQSLRRILQILDPVRFAELEARYYPVMVKVSGGTFWMGCDTLRNKECEPDELPRHQVLLSDFEIAETETTFWQYELYTRANGLPILSPAGWSKDGDNPVVRVSWLDACDYANWLSNRLGRNTAYIKDTTSTSTGYSYRLGTAAPGAFRLPTEAEWEYAARGGNQPRETLYAGSDSLDLVAWNMYNSKVEEIERTHPVGTKEPNSIHLFDMNGNVWEWCWDWYDPYTTQNIPVENPEGPVDGKAKVLRSSSYSDYKNLHLSNRFSLNPEKFHDSYGFRLARRQ